MRLFEGCVLLLLVIVGAETSQLDDVEDFLQDLEDLDSDAGFIPLHRHEKTSPSFFHPSSIHHLIRDLKCNSKRLLPCQANCQHDKVFLANGCCRCACRKNFALISSTKCSRASWSSWGHWSKCIRTEWGGLQMKERICKSKGKDAPGACTDQGSESRTCTAVNGAFRIRKNVRHLTNEEMHDLIQAMTKFKRDTSTKGYRNIITWHGYPGRCPWYNKLPKHDDNHCSWHHHPLFLPWHRLITVQLELGLQRHLKNKTLGIPYWDWTEHALDIPYLVRHPQIYDPVLKKYVHNPFYRTLIWKNQTTTLYTHRNIWYPGVLMDGLLRKGTVRALLSHNYFNFDLQLANNPHDQIHNCFCYKNPPNKKPEWCDYGMPTVTYAAWDPVFLLHHSAMDRVFVMRRHLEENAGVSDWTKSRVDGQFLAVHEFPHRDVTVENAFEWPLSPFCNKTMNPESITGKENAWTLHRGYYGEQLFGYKYENLDLGNGYSWEDLQKDFRRNNLERKYWNDDFFDTKLGPLTNGFCTNPHMSDSNCMLRC